MFELFNHDARIPFVRYGRYTVAVSFALMLVSIVLLFRPGFELGLDFTGGSMIELRMDQPVELATVREALAANGHEGALVQSFGGTRDVLVRLAPREGADALELGREVHAELARSGLPSELKGNAFVLPQVGKELAQDGTIAIVVVLIGILLYIGARFQFKFGAAAIVGEIHDVLVTAAIFILLGREFDITVLAGFLSVAGYSINDKVVVFDRIREMFRTTTKLTPAEVVDRSINTTLSRTIMTALTTALAMLGLFLFGGPSVENFALVMLIGIVVGTLSSIMFAAQLLLLLGVNKRDLMPKARDLSELERRP
jgi:preprotein translocase subunit SecF